MAVRKEGGWVVEFMFRGVRIFRRLPRDRTKADAQQLESKLRRQIFDAVDLGKLPDPLLTKVIDEWLETKKGSKAEDHTRSHARAVCGVAKGACLSECPSVANRVRATGQAPATINRRLCVLKAVAKYAYQKGYTQENLSGKIQLLPENNARHVYLSQAQVKALLKAAPTPESRAFIAWAVYTGMRQGEVMALKADDIVGGTARLQTSKIGLPRHVPLVAALNPYLRYIPFRSHKRTLYAGFEVARAAIGMPELHYHDLRHTTASFLINEGHPLYVVGELLGHKSVQTTKRYAHLSTETMRAAMDSTFEGWDGRRRKKAGLPEKAGGQGAAKKALRRVDGKARGDAKDG